MILMSIFLVMQYFYFSAEIEKNRLMRQEYSRHIQMLKVIIQDKNIDVIADDLDDAQEQDVQDLDALQDKTLIDNALDESQEMQIQLSDSLLDLVLPVDQQDDILDEQKEDTHKFQFISLQDELQLKKLRKQTRQIALSRKKIKQKPAEKNLGAEQIAHLKKTHKIQGHQDFTFHWPLELHHFWLSSLFGARKKANGQPGFHYGIDLAALKGTPIKAAAAGKVIQAQFIPGYGNNILIQHNKYYRTRYAHLHKINVTTGQQVAQGQKIGTVGDSGSVRKSGRDASHLHFEIYHNGSHVNPLRYLFT